MQLDSEIRKLLTDINFIERYEEIVEDHKLDKQQKSYSPIPESVINHICELGYESTYNKKENFYKILFSLQEYEIQFNIVIVYSTVQFVWHLRKGTETIELGWGTWESLIEFLKLERYSNRPYFYEEKELKQIITGGIEIFNDFLDRLSAKESLEA